MAKKPIILGVESSCDETAAAIVSLNEKGESNLLSNIVHSQYNEHSKFGGIVPEVAARSHLKNISFIVAEAIKQANISSEEVNAVSVSCGPGVIGGFFLMLAAYITARRKNFAVEETFNIPNVKKTAKDAALAFLLPVIILGGIFGGVVTATEGAGLAVVASLIIGFNCAPLPVGPLICNSGRELYSLPLLRTKTSFISPLSIKAFTSASLPF